VEDDCGGLNTYKLIIPAIAIIITVVVVAAIIAIVIAIVVVVVVVIIAVIVIAVVAVAVVVVFQKAFATRGNNSRETKLIPATKDSNPNEMHQTPILTVNFCWKIRFRNWMQ
jgi:amino acid transporter